MIPERWKEELVKRRALLIAPFAFAGLVALSSRGSSDPPEPGGAAQEVAIVEFDDDGKRLGTARLAKVVKPAAEWKRMLGAQQFYVTRRKSTDTAFTGTYYRLEEAGLFRCVCCATALFRTQEKFDSGTGWPSFWAPIAAENVRTATDVLLLEERVEVLCRRCDAHLGHLFNDGPEPTNLRYCLNESALRFVKRRTV